MILRIIKASDAQPHPITANCPLVECQENRYYEEKCRRLRYDFFHRQACYSEICPLSNNCEQTSTMTPIS